MPSHALIVASRPTAPLLAQVLTTYNMEELKAKLGDRLIIIEE